MLRRLSIGLFLMLGACGSARLVQQTQYGGIIALQGDRNKAMEDADRMMAQHCGPNNFTVVQQGEEVIGTDTSYGERTDQASNNSGTGSQSASETNGGVSTRNATEWRVHYQCNGAGGPPAGGAPAEGTAPPPPPPPPPAY